MAADLALRECPAYCLPPVALGFMRHHVPSDQDSVCSSSFDPFCGLVLQCLPVHQGYACLGRHSYAYAMASMTIGAGSCPFGASRQGRKAYQLGRRPHPTVLLPPRSAAVSAASSSVAAVQPELPSTGAGRGGGGGGGQKLRRIVLLRHADSDSSSMAVRDHDRPISEQGRQDAGQVQPPPPSHNSAAGCCCRCCCGASSAGITKRL